VSLNQCSIRIARQPRRFATDRFRRRTGTL
jgi:hypothetical protein